MPPGVTPSSPEDAFHRFDQEQFLRSSTNGTTPAVRRVHRVRTSSSSPAFVSFASTRARYPDNTNFALFPFCGANLYLCARSWQRRRWLNVRLFAVALDRRRLSRHLTEHGEPNGAPGRILRCRSSYVRTDPIPTLGGDILEPEELLLWRTEGARQCSRESGPSPPPSRTLCEWPAAVCRIFAWTVMAWRPAVASVASLTGRMTRLMMYREP